jgi:MFS family permease
MTDWAGVYMRETLEVAETQVGWGFAIYALFMAGGRLLGDGLIGFFGSRRLLQFCGLLAFIGLMILASQPSLALSLLGFMLTGAGVSVGAPILYAESAKVPGLPTGAGLATFNTFATMGFLGGPAFIGFLAEAFSLPTAFGVVGGGAAIWAIFSRRM